MGRWHSSSSRDQIEADEGILVARSDVTRARVVAVLAAALLAATACSSAKSHADGSGGSNGTATKSTLILGSIVDATGASSAIFGPAKGVLNAWVSYTNANGGIDGHPVKMIVMDDQNTPSVGLADAHTLVNQDHIIALVGSEDNSAPGWKDYLAAQKIPVIGAAGAVSLAFTPADKLYYPTGTDLSIQKELGLQLAGAQQKTKVGDVYCAEVVACLQGAQATEAAVKNAGYTFTKSVKVSTTAPSYVAPCLTLRDAATQTIQLAVATTTVKAVADACAQQNYFPFYVADGAQITSDYTSDPAFKNAGGAIDEFPWWDTSNPAIAQYKQVMDQYDPSGENTFTTAAEAWAAALTFEAGAKAANLGSSPSSQDIINGLDTLSNDTLGGLVPPVTYTNGNRSLKCGYVFLIKDGAFTLANNGKLDCVSS